MAQHRLQREVSSYCLEGFPNTLHNKTKIKALYSVGPHDKFKFFFSTFTLHFPKEIDLELIIFTFDWSTDIS